MWLVMTVPHSPSVWLMIINFFSSCDWCQLPSLSVPPPLVYMGITVPCLSSPLVWLFSVRLVMTARFFLLCNWWRLPILCSCMIGDDYLPFMWLVIIQSLVFHLANRLWGTGFMLIGLWLDVTGIAGGKWVKKQGHKKGNRIHESHSSLTLRNVINRFMGD